MLAHIKPQLALKFHLEEKDLIPLQCEFLLYVQVFGLTQFPSRLLNIKI